MAASAEALKKLQQDLAAERLERQKLEQMLKDEIAERKKLQDWIRNNIGGNLEHVLAKVDNHLASSSKSQQPHMPGAVKLLPSVSKEDSKPTPISNNNNSEQPRSRASTLTKANTPSTSTNVAPKSDEKELPSSVIAASNSSQPLSAAQLILMEKFGQQPPVQTASNSSASELKRTNSMTKSQLPSVSLSESIKGTPPPPAAPPASKSKKTGEKTKKKLAVDDYEDEGDSEDWSDSDDEERERLRKALRPRVLAETPKLQKLELVIPDPTPSRPNDASKMSVLSKANIEHSVHLHVPVYGMPTEELIPRVREFATRGGKVFFVPPDLSLNPFFFGLYDDDFLFPVCNDGLNLSQMLYLVCKGVKRAHGVPEGKDRVCAPHGALFGYDALLEGDNQRFSLEADRAWFHKSFHATFDQHTRPRFGEQVGKNMHFNQSRKDWKRSRENRQQMKEFFDLFYFQPQVKNDESRLVYLCFQQSVSVVMKRIQEVNQGSLARFTLIALPFGEDNVVQHTSPILEKMNCTREQYCVMKSQEMYNQFVLLFSPSTNEQLNQFVKQNKKK